MVTGDTRNAQKLYRQDAKDAEETKSLTAKNAKDAEDYRYTQSAKPASCPATRARMCHS